jgi:hypothetical protein
LKEQGTHHIINGMDDALSFTILRGSVRTRHPQKHAIGGEEGPSARVVKLAPVITLDSLGGVAELCGHI